MSVTWFNGDFVAGKISLDPADRGLTLGDGAFETIAVHDGRSIWLAEHVLRMRDAAQELGIEFDQDKIIAAVKAVLQKTSSASEVLRITLTRGVVEPRSLTGHSDHPSLLVTLAPFAGVGPDTITLATSTIRRNEMSPSSRLKSLSYVDAILAAREVMAIADDALMLNTAGHVASTTIGNLFLLRDDKLITPRADQGILCGITRAKLLAQAEEAVVTVADLFAADAVFRSNSLRLVTQVSMLDGKSLGSACVHHFKLKLQEGFMP